MRSVSAKPNLALQQLLNHLDQVGHMTRQEHLHLTSLLLTPGKLTAAEHAHLNRLFDRLQTGRFKLID